MAIAPNGKKVILVADELSPNHRDCAILDRLRMLGFTVELREPLNITTEDLHDLDLILVSSHAPDPVLRDPSVPVIACSATALYDMGMTFGTSHVDFGYTNYDTVYIDDTMVGHPLSAGLAGSQKITVTPGHKGWAKPASTARVVATIGGNRDKALVFAYARGDQMATMLAAHRRVAFLIAGDKANPTTARGWDLFDAAVEWAVNGSEEPAKHGTQKRGRWLPTEDTPSRVLSVEEYRDWRDDRVAKRVFYKLAAILSVLGFSGIVAAVVLIMNSFKNVAEDLTLEIKSRVTTAKTDIKSHVDARIDREMSQASGVLEKHVQGAIAQHIVNKTGVSQKIDDAKDEIEEAANQEIEAMKKGLPKDVEEIAKNSVPPLAEEYFKNELAKKPLEGRIYDAIKSKINTRDGSVSVRRRTEALRLMQLIGSDERQLQSDVMDLIKNEPLKHRELLRLALRSFKSARVNETTRADDKKKIIEANHACRDVIMRRLADLEGDPEARADLGNEFSIALSRLPGDHATHLAEWLTKNPNHPATGIVIYGMSQMDGEEKMVELAKLAFDHRGGSQRTRYLGNQGLSSLAPVPKSAFPQKVRVDVLRKLLDDLSSDERRKNNNQWGPDLYDHVTRLKRAIMNFDNTTIREKLQPESGKFSHKRLDEIYQAINDGYLRTFQDKDLFSFLNEVDENVPRNRALINLLRPQDWNDIVVPRFPIQSKEYLNLPLDERIKKRREVDEVLYNFVARIELEMTRSNGAQKQPIQEYKDASDVLQKSLGLDGALYYVGSARGVEFAIQHGSFAEASNFLSQFHQKFQGKIDKQTGFNFAGQTALVAAIRKDGESPEKFKETGAMLKRIIKPNDRKPGILETVCLALSDARPPRRFGAARAWATSEIHTFLFNVIREEGGSTNFEAQLAAVRALGDSIDPGNAPTDTGKLLLAKLQEIEIVSDVLDPNVDSDSRRNNERKKELVAGIVEAIGRFCDYAEDERVVLNDLRNGIPPSGREELTYVRNQLTDFITRRHERLARRLAFRDWAAAVKELTISIQLKPSTTAHGLRGRAYLVLGNDAMLAGNPELARESYGAAIDDLTKAMQLDPDDPRHYRTRGEAFMRSTDQTKAIADFEKSVEMLGPNPRDFQLLALAYIQLKDEAETRKHTNRAVNLIDNNRAKANIQENVGLLYLRKGNWVKAFENTTEVQSLAPEMAWNSLIRAIAAKKLDREADENSAFKSWIEFGTKVDLIELQGYIPADLIDPYKKRSIDASKKFE